MFRAAAITAREPGESRIIRVFGPCKLCAKEYLENDNLQAENIRRPIPGIGRRIGNDRVTPIGKNLQLATSCTTHYFNQQYKSNTEQTGINEFDKGVSAEAAIGNSAKKYGGNRN